MFNCKCKCGHLWDATELPRSDAPGYVTGLRCPVCNGRKIEVRGTDDESRRKFAEMKISAMFEDMLNDMMRQGGIPGRARVVGAESRPGLAGIGGETAVVGQCAKCGEFAQLHKLASSDGEKMVCNKCL
jgi:hypothetical protein